MLREKLERVIFYLLLLFLPTQFGKHFWPDFAIISGIRVDYLSPTLYMTDILVGALFITWIIGKAQRIKFNVQRLTFPIVLVVFLFLNIYLSHNYFNGAYHVVKLLEFSFVAYYIVRTISTLSQIKKIFLFMGIGVIGQSLLAIAQFIKQGSLGGMFYLFGERLFTAATPGIANVSINGELLLRPYGTFPHPNVLAGFLLLSMIGLLFTLPWVKRFKKIIWVTALLLGSSALLLTMSRISIILWFCLLLLLFLTTSLRALFKQSVAISYRIASSFFLAMTIIFVVSLLFITPLGTRLLQTNLAEEAVVQRTELIRASVIMVAQQPIVGVGFGNFLPTLATVQKPLTFGLYLQPVHNIFILVLTETGIVGLGLFVWFLVKTYHRLFVLIKKEGALPYRLFVMLLTVVLILGSFDHYFLTLQQGQLLLALILGLCWTNQQK